MEVLMYKVVLSKGGLCRGRKNYVSTGIAVEPKWGVISWRLVDGSRERCKVKLRE